MNGSVGLRIEASQLPLFAKGHVSPFSEIGRVIQSYTLVGLRSFAKPTGSFKRRSPRSTSRGILRLSNNRLGAPSSDASGTAIEKTIKGRIHRYSLRAWHPAASIPAAHFTREELASFIGVVIPPTTPRKPPRRKV
jgi:hypothetical protein